MPEYENTDNTNNRLRKYILPETFDFTTFPADYDNAILEIRYVFDLNGGDITFPENVTLLFNGGRITNYGTITGNNTKIDAGLVQIFDGSVMAHNGTGYASKFTGGWDLEELVPQWFGAMNNAGIDSSNAFQAMFNFIKDINSPVSVLIPAGDYKTSKTLELPRTSKQEYFNVSGYGATITIDQPDISIFKMMPVDQNDASRVVSQVIPVIKGISFIGDGLIGQKGIEIGATYSMVVEDCSFTFLEYGTIGTFCLSSKWTNLRFSKIGKFPLTIQSAGSDFDGNQVWSGATGATSASNVSTVTGCRIHGIPGQIASYTVLSSDMVKLVDCISEGGGDLYDVFFDKQNTTTTNNFIIEGFHAESPNAKVNLKLKGGKNFLIKNLRRSYPAAIFDVTGSVAFNLVLDGCYLGNLHNYYLLDEFGDIVYEVDEEGELILDDVTGEQIPVPAPVFIQSGSSTGSSYTFRNISNSDVISDPSKWKNGLPYAFIVERFKGRNAGAEKILKGPFTFTSLLDSDKLRVGSKGDAFRLNNYNLLFDEDNTNYIGKIRYGKLRPKGIFLGDEGANFDAGGRIADCISGGLNILNSDIGTVAANSTVSITLTSADYPDELTGLTTNYVTSLNVDDGDLNPGLMIANVNTINEGISIRFVNVTGLDITSASSHSTFLFAKFSALKF